LKKKEKSRTPRKKRKLHLFHAGERESAHCRWEKKCADRGRNRKTTKEDGRAGRKKSPVSVMREKESYDEQSRYRKGRGFGQRKAGKGVWEKRAPLLERERGSYPLLSRKKGNGAR